MEEVDGNVGPEGDVGPDGVDIGDAPLGNEDANSREAWDNMFAPGGHWDTVGGPEMTRTFARLICTKLDHVIVQAIGREEGVTVLDWGCARGEAVDIFDGFWPEATVFGLDFSYVAMEQASSAYGLRFFYNPLGKIQQPFDVVVNSNVMEHLDDPIATLKEHLRRTGRFYIILTPYKEDWSDSGGNEKTPDERKEAGHHHIHRFSDSSFPGSVESADGKKWNRVQNTVHAVTEGPWIGNQMLVVYARAAMDVGL